MSQLRTHLVNIARRTRRYVIPEALVDATQRLDKALAHVSGISRRRTRDLISNNKVAVNGKKTKKLSKEVQGYEVVEVPLDAVPDAESRQNAHFDFEVLKLNKWFLAVNKPVGKLSQLKESSEEEPREQQSPLEHEVKTLLALHYNGLPGFVKMIHRLDRITSGVSVFVLKRSLMPHLQEAWTDGTVERRYRAIVQGNPPWNFKTVRGPIARDHNHPWKFKVSGNGKTARTVVSIVAQGKGYAVVDCVLNTGRTHQIRVHLSHLGYPIVGDYLYGYEEEIHARNSAERVMLHSHSVKFLKEVRNIRLNVTAPLPQKFIEYQQAARPVDVLLDDEEEATDTEETGALDTEEEDEFIADTMKAGDTTAQNRLEAMRELAQTSFHNEDKQCSTSLQTNARKQGTDSTVSSSKSVRFQFVDEDDSENEGDTTVPSNQNNTNYD
eukprot:gb/GECG01016522.1/.p1 GENE.gb/GECG01016522.1/~~gb/GECG01016522.1/.p1  ORF type:complete len:439 (+),score=59.91 gb/GECG01016522.1/:1-1317(+)